MMSMIALGLMLLFLGVVYFRRWAKEKDTGWLLMSIGMVLCVAMIIYGFASGSYPIG